jgi:hypothetical protein
MQNTEHHLFTSFSFFFLLMAEECAPIAGLKSLTGMLATDCFNGQAFFHLTKSLHSFMASKTKKEQVKTASWFLALCHEMAYSTIHTKSHWTIRESGGAIEICTEVS